MLKALINLSKFLGQHDEFTKLLKNHGVKWATTDNSFNSFLAIVNNNHSNLGAWYSKAMEILRDNEKLWLRFNLITGMRKEESINSFNLIIKLNTEGKLNEYFNEELGILEHFKYGDLFLRQTKNVYISMLTKDLINEITQSHEISYPSIRKRLNRNKLNLRIKECRSYFATFLRNHGVISEYVDLIQGRIPKSVFARHYLKIEDLKTLVAQVLTVTNTIEECLLK